MAPAAETKRTSSLACPVAKVSELLVVPKSMPMAGELDCRDFTLHYFAKPAGALGIPTWLRGSVALGSLVATPILYLDVESLQNAAMNVEFESLRFV